MQCKHRNGAIQIHCKYWHIMADIIEDTMNKLEGRIDDAEER